jgi:hypothetical protein
MKLKIAVLMLGVVTVCAPAATQKKSSKKAAPATQAVTIPKDAVPNADGASYSYTDKDGKKWTYTKTPFGIMKAPTADPATAAAASTPDLNGAKAIDKGDTVRFERAGPFGVTAWEKKKSDLNDEERRVFDAQNAKPESHD